MSKYNEALERLAKSIGIIRDAMDYVTRTRNAIDSDRAFQLVADLLSVKDYLEDAKDITLDAAIKEEDEGKEKETEN